MTTVKATKLTYEAYMALQETRQRCEVVDGVLFVAPSALRSQRSKRVHPDPGDDLPF